MPGHEGLARLLVDGDDEVRVLDVQAAHRLDELWEVARVLRLDRLSDDGLGDVVDALEGD